jgi:glucan-binding YG repeat protein
MGVTKNAVRSVAWYPGLPWYFEFRGMIVEHDVLPAGERISVLKGLLAEHPEGYVLYAGYTSWPHAVVVVDCVDGELQVVEPFDGSVVPLSESELVSAYNADSYWYVSSYVTPPSDADQGEPDREAPGTWILEEGFWRYERDGEPSVGWDLIDGSWFLFDDEGVMLTGWQMVNGSWYYLLGSGHMHAGWLPVGDDWYYLDGSGAMATGWRLFGDTWYCMGLDGRMLTGLQDVNGKAYLFDESGAMLTGWQLVDDAWSFFDEDGALQRDMEQDEYEPNATGALE